MKVHILVTVNNPNLADLSVLVFESLRTGFPTASVEVFLNGQQATQLSSTVCARSHLSRKKYDLIAWDPTSTRHHAAWIAGVVAIATEPTVILDPDVIFWSDVESTLRALPTGPLLHGRYVPRMWNEWAGCPSVPRLHTSFLYIPDPAALRTALANAYPRAHEPLGEYCPADPWSPAVRFDMGQPTFWDTGAGAFNMLPSLCRPFAPDLLDLYSHVNSPTFYDQFVHRLSDPESYSRTLNLALTEPERLRGFWRAEDAYYEEMRRRLQSKEAK